MLYGKTVDQDHIQITTLTLMASANAYFQYCYKKLLTGVVDVVDVLLSMLKTRKYTVSPSFCIPSQGSGVDLWCFTALWKITMLPHLLETEDTELVFFLEAVKPASRFFTDDNANAQQASEIAYDGDTLAANLKPTDGKTRR
eukprot:483893-Rhodomonas_salina.2